MKSPKRTKKAIKYLEEIADLLKYYMGEEYTNSKIGDGNNTISDKIKHLKLLIDELSMDQKLHDRRLWNKFKAIARVGHDESDDD